MHLIFNIHEISVELVIYNKNNYLSSCSEMSDYKVSRLNSCLS
jgi:hypothetical protein